MIKSEETLTYLSLPSQLFLASQHLPDRDGIVLLVLESENFVPHKRLRD